MCGFVKKELVMPPDMMMPPGAPPMGPPPGMAGPGGPPMGPGGPGGMDPMAILQSLPPEVIAVVQ